jgi:hypothetical protein
MDLQDIRRMLACYRELIASSSRPVPYRPACLDAAAQPTLFQAVCHALWMCDEMDRRLSAHPVSDPGVDPAAEGRANRWLGFVQGVLWVSGLRTVAAMRDDVRAVDLTA